MTLQYDGIRLKSEVYKNSTSLIYPVKDRTARNNSSIKVKQVELVKVIQILNEVTKTNLNDFHIYFTNNETFE